MLTLKNPYKMLNCAFKLSEKFRQSFAPNTILLAGRVLLLVLNKE